MIDLRNLNILGNLAAEALESAGVVLNRNSIPYDPNPPFYPSGIRLGTPGITSRGMGILEMEKIASFIARVLKDISSEEDIELQKKKKKRQEIISASEEIKKVREEVKELCSKFPVTRE